ncbi:hypothetical protein ACEPAH_9629 [Sanghuangporus vaninii]
MNTRSGDNLNLGWHDANQKSWLDESLSWAEVTQRAAGASDITEVYELPSISERARVISGLRWIRLFSSEKICPRKNYARLDKLMQYVPGERVLIMLQHKIPCIQPIMERPESEGIGMVEKVL